MLSIIFLSLLTFSFLLAGISNDVRNITHVTVISAITVGFIMLIVSKKKVKTPEHFTPLLVFAIILQIYWVFAKDKVAPFYYSLLFTEGLSLWFTVYNLEKKFVQNLQLIFLIPAVIYSLFYFLDAVLNTSFLKLSSLFFLTGDSVGHLQIGNFWVSIVAFLIGSRFSGVAIFSEFIFFLGGAFFIIFSKSRSAYLALFASLIVIFKNKNLTKWLAYPAMFISLFFIIYVSTARSPILSRPYFLQSLIGFSHYPFGVGMGNFRLISEPFYKAGGVFGSFSDATHNIFLEAISGVGVLAIPFIYWGYKTIVKALASSSKNHFGWVSLFLALFVIFMTDLSYVIPNLFWLWFIALGMTQREDLATA